MTPKCQSLEWHKPAFHHEEGQVERQDGESAQTHPSLV